MLQVQKVIKVASVHGWEPKQPPVNWRDLFHCWDCAWLCVNYGKTREQARDFNHGTDDEKFCTFLGSD
jgi:hypothetical protein